MTQTTQTVLEQYQIRKSKKQKRAFAAYVRQIAEQNGYAYREEKGAFGAINLIVGDDQSAKVLYTAHYDTCARLPFPNFITPKCFVIYLLYQILLTAAMLLPAALILTFLPELLVLVGIPSGTAIIISGLAAYAALIAMLLLLLCGPANKVTANDNTSGVTVLLDALQEMPKELQGEVAFIFFDLEEAGLFGSAGYASKHKKLLTNRPLLNFDCVSDGNHLLFALRRGAHPYAQQLTEAFPVTDVHDREVAERGVFYPSDQANFKCGVGVAALKKSRRLGILYMNRIHTKRDTVYQSENISYLCQGCIRFAQSLTQSKE